MEVINTASEAQTKDGIIFVGERPSPKAEWERPALKTLSIFESKGGFSVPTADGVTGFS